MSKEEDNKAVVDRWFMEFWGKNINLAVIDEIAAPDMLLKYSLHEPRRGRKDIKAFMTDFRSAFPDLNFWGTADLIAEGDYVVGQWEGGGTPYGSGVQGFSDRRPACRDRAQDALHRHHSAEGGEQERSSRKSVSTTA
jgi:SnoaL-like polyketide cyclase